MCSWGSPRVGHTGTTRGCFTPELPPLSKHLPRGRLHSSGEHNQHSPSWNTRQGRHTILSYTTNIQTSSFTCTRRNYLYDKINSYHSSGDIKKLIKTNDHVWPPPGPYTNTRALAQHALPNAIWLAATTSLPKGTSHDVQSDAESN